MEGWLKCQISPLVKYRQNKKCFTVTFIIRDYLKEMLVSKHSTCYRSNIDTETLILITIIVKNLYFKSYFISLSLFLLFTFPLFQSEVRGQQSSESLQESSGTDYGPRVTRHIAEKGTVKPRTSQLSRIWGSWKHKQPQTLTPWNSHLAQNLHNLDMLTVVIVRSKWWQNNMNVKPPSVLKN